MRHFRFKTFVHSLGAFRGLAAAQDQPLKNFKIHMIVLQNYQPCIQIVVNKIANLLDKGQIVAFNTNENEDMPKFNCYAETVEFLITELRKRMPKSLNLYKCEGEYKLIQTWRPKHGVNVISSKLQPMTVTRVSRQVNCIVSKNKVDILEPWFIQPPKKVRNKKKKDKNSEEK